MLYKISLFSSHYDLHNTYFQYISLGGKIGNGKTTIQIVRIAKFVLRNDEYPL